ncbi:MAG TPA: TolC family protein [Kofleriaceae bacterium]|nr:TolC family protein [Kofleriaceae bacterium]
MRDPKRARLVHGVAAVSLAGAAACAHGLPPLRPDRADRAAAAPRLAGLAMLAAAGEGAAAEPAGAEGMTLAAAFQLALAHSEQVSIAQRGVIEAQILARDRWTEIVPSVNVSGGGLLQRERRVGTVVLTPAEQLVFEARVQQPLYRRGFAASRAAGEHGRGIASASLAREREQLARDVVDVFIAVLRTRRQLDLAVASVARARAQHQHAASRVKAGGALRNAELLALLDLRRAEQQHVTAQRDVRFASVAFQRLIGRAPPPALELPEAPPLPGPAEARELAQRRRDLQALQLRVQQAQAEEAATRQRRWWPRIDLEASVQYNHPEVFNRSVDWRVLGQVTVPLLDSGRELTAEALRANETRVAALALERQLELVLEEVELAALQLAATADAARLADEQVAAAQEYYKLVDKQFRLGAITFLEVTNAQAVLVEAENTLEVARMERVRAVYDYLFAIGALDLRAPGAPTASRR